MITGIYN